MQKADLPSRLDKLEVKVDNTNKSLDDMKDNQTAFQIEVRQKLDVIIDSRKPR